MEIKNFVHRLLSLLLCAALVLSCVPGISISAMADMFADVEVAEPDAAEPDIEEIGDSSSATETTEFEYVTEVQSDVAYKFGMNNGDFTYYFTGAMSGAYGATSSNISDAVDVYLESADGGYYLYFMDGSTKTYIHIYESVSSSYTAYRFGITTDEPAVCFTYNSDVNTLIAAYGEDSYWMGTYGTYPSITASSTYYIEGENAANVDVSQYPARLYPVDETEGVEPEEPASTEPGVIASGTSSDNISWVLTEDGHLNISGSGEMTEAPWTDWCDDITSVTISDGITSICTSAFHSCGYITSVSIPDGVQSIGEYAFYSCVGLTNITIPEGVTTIGRSAFLECTNLSEVIIPDSVTTIGNAAFSHNYNLVSVVMGSGVQSLGDEVFVYGYALKTVRFKGNAPTFGENCFYSAGPIVYYPANNATWTGDVMQSYGGSVTWVALGAVTGIELSDELIVIAVGEQLNENYIQVQAVYEDDFGLPVALPVDYKDLTVSDYDTSEVGRQEITVSYGEYSATAILAVHEGAKDQLIDSALYPESNHNYGNSLNEYKTFTVPGATSITLTFSESSETESNYDYVYIYDGQGNQIACYDGSFGGETVTVPGDTVIVRLYTDSSATRWGYSFSEIKADGVTHEGTAVERVDPTCEEDGHTAGIYCTICDKTMGTTVLPALGHCYDSEVTPPTQDTQGYTTYTCPTCGDSYVDDYTTYDNVANGNCGENATWVLSYEGTLTISGTGPMYEEYGVDTMTWKDTGYAITKVIIEDGVTTIAAYAFSDCRELTSVSMADSVESIGYDAFYYCYNLTDLTIGNGVVTIDDLAFNNCSGLTEVTIPASVRTIGSRAFQYCASLQRVVMEDGATTIGDYAFHCNYALSEIVLPETLTTIESSAFAYCDALTEINIPASVNNIGTGAFYSCQGLMAINVDEDNQTYSSDSCGALFNKAQTVLIQFPLALGGEYSIPGTVTEIGYNAFYAGSLSAVSIPGSVTIWGDNAFMESDELTSVTFGDGITAIGSCAFYDCDNLKSVYLPDSVQTIGYDAFQYCSSLTNVTCGSGVAYIGDYAFRDCYNLQNITFTGDAPEIEYNAFNNVTATAYYPMNNTTWTEDVLQDYYGDITWVALGGATGFEVAEDVIMLCVGDRLNSENLHAEVIREGDVRTPAAFAELTVSDYDHTTAGRYEVTVSWGDYTDTVILAIHNGDSAYLVDSSLYPESAHNYANNMDETKELTVPGAKSITLTFSENTYLEDNWDYLYIYDGNDQLVLSTSGSQYAGQTVTVTGDTVKLRMTTDGSSTYYGYSFSSITADTMEHTGEEIPAVAPTCTETGYTAGVNCTICEACVRDELPALGHSYDTVTTDPTPDAQGYTTYTCTVCNDSYIDNYVSYDNVANGSCGENVTWKLSFDGVLTISGTGEMYNYDYWDDPTPWGSAITGLIIEDGVTGIGDYAFYSCGNLTSVTIPDSVTIIGSHSFFRCDSLTFVTIGNCVTTIGSGAFYDCDSLTSVTIPDSVTTIGSSAFGECDSLTSVTIGSSVTTIDQAAFTNCDSLTAVTIPDSVTTIGREAFHSCDSLTAVTIPESVITIGYYAFADCNSLTQIEVLQNNPNYSSESGVLYNKDKTELITAPGAISGVFEIPYGVTTIGGNAFEDCDSLVCVTIPDSVTVINNNAFSGCNSLTSMTIPDSVTSIGSYAFNECNQLATVTLGSGLTSMGEYAFAWCYDLTEVNIPEGVTVIGDYVFYNCDNLTSVVIPDSVTTIGHYAFYDCDDLTAVDIPDSVTTIGEGAFRYCDSLTIIYFTGDAPEIARDTFDGVTATAYYPMNNDTWTEDVMQNCYGNITWVARGELMGIELADPLVLLCVGEELTANHFQVTAIREGGIREPVAFADLTVSEFDNSVIGRNEVTVSYSGLETTAVVAVHEGREEQVVNSSLYPESDHNYGNNIDETKVLTIPGTESITLTFSGETYTESCDYIYILDGNNNEIASYSGSSAAGVTVTVPGDTVKIRLDTDYSVTYYGYSFSEIRAELVKHTGTATEGLEPTCTEAGYTAGIDCEICEEVVNSYALPALGHSYEGAVTDPTPETGGYTTFTCTVCGDSYVGEHTTYDNVANGSCGDDLTWVLSFEGTLTISGTGEMYSYGSNTLPWKNTRYTVRKAIIEEGVTTIGQYAFLQCEELAEITLPSTLTRIGYAAFNNCYALTSIDIPDSVEYINSYAFLNCSALESVELPAGITEINYGIFLNCSGLKNITIPDTVETICGEAFYGCSALTEVNIPDSVTTIEDSAFYNCSNLTSIQLPENLQTLGSNAFTNCKALTQIVLPDSITSFGSYVFSDCENLEYVELPAGITELPYGCFIRCFDLKSVVIPESVTTLREWCLADIRAMNAITVPDTVQIIEQYAFSCNEAKSIVVGSGVTSIGVNAFSYCGELESVTFTGNAPAMEEDMFIGTSATVYYPMNNETWTETACQNYGGDITWVALGQITGIRVVDDVIMASVGKQLDISKLQVVSVHEGGAELLIDPAALTVSECDTSTVGKKNITVTYGEYSANIVVAVHNGEENQLVDSSLYPESDHDYSDYLYEKKTLTIPSALSITLTFSEETLTENCDYIYILDRNDRQIASYSGDRAAGVTVTVPGDTVQIILDTDSSITYYGYSFTEITANVLEHTGETVEGKDATCTEDGYTSAVLCEICDQLIPQDYIPMVGHAYESVVTEPTPEENGYTTHTCINCGDSYTDSIVDYFNVASGDTGEVSWVLAYDGTLTIYGEGRMESYAYYWYAPWYYCGYPVKYLMVEEGVENIGSYAFRGMELLETADLASTVTSLGYSAFESCPSLQEVNFLGYSVTIGDMAFRDCYVLQSIVIPDNSTYIGDYAFQNCFSLESVTLPSMIDSISYSCFANCEALETIEIPGSVTTINSYAFENCDALQSVDVPVSVNYIGMYAFADCDSLTGITVNADNSAYCTDEFGVLFTKDMKQLIQAPGGLSGNYTVPSSVECIWENAFANCNSLTGVTIPESVTYIDQATFYSCDNLVDVNMPDTITSIAYRAFAECVSMEDISIPNQVSTIVDYAFSECYSLGNVVFNGDAPSIDDWVFCEVSAVAYYPADNETWTEDMFRNYGGNLAWVTSGAIGILYQPMEVVTIAGETVEFNVEAVGSDLTYQWQYQTSPEGSWKNVSAASGKTAAYSMKAQTRHNGYQYRCEITDGAGNVVYTNTAPLFVLGVEKQPDSIYILENGDAIFELSATGKEVTYQWQFRSSESGQWAVTSAEGFDTPVLTVPAAAWRNGYQYRCVITDMNGNELISDVAMLYVLSITTQPVNRTATIGADTEFTVVATGGELTYQWQYRTSSSGSWKNVSAASGKTANYSMTAQGRHAGYQYRCIITDAQGNTVTSNMATLYVWGVNTQPSSQSVKEGQTAKFTVSAVGSGLTYQWQYRTSSSGSWKNVSTANGKTANYSLTAQSRHNGYQYRCRITDSEDRVVSTKTVTLYVLSIRTQPVHKTVKAGSKATFTVSATGRSLTYQWQYRTSASSSWKNVSVASGKTASYSMTAQSRHHGYQYRCQIKDSAGNTVYTNIVNLSVLGITGQPASQTLVAGRTAKFTVSATGTDVTYQWQYRTSSSGSWTNVSAASGKTASYSMTAQSRHHGYQYRCKVTDAKGNSIYTNVATLYVLGIKTQPANKSVNAGATAKFTVSAVGKNLTYQWQYRTSSSGSWKNVSAASGKTASYSMTAQSRHNGYQYRCKITDSAGNVIYTNVVKLTVK